MISLPMVVTDVGDERYLVSMLGNNVNWVRNVNAAEGRAVLHDRKRELVLLEPVDPGARAKILKRYLEVAPGPRPHFPIDWHSPVAQFERIVTRYPVFRIAPDTTTRQ